MKRTNSACVWSVIGLVLIWTGLLCAAEDKTGVVIKVGGNNSLIQSTENWGKAYAEENPGVTVVAQGGGTDVGFKKMLSKEIDIVFSADPLSEDEKKKASEKGLELVEHLIAWGGVCVVIHPGNPVDSLTVDQVRQMLVGDIKSWKEVGGPDVAVQPFMRDENTPRMTSVFHDRFLRGKPLSPNAKQSTSFRRLLKSIEEEKGAIGLVGCLALTWIKNPLKVLALKKDAGAQAVKWSAETFKDRTYPIARPLLFYWDAKSPNAVHLTKFADYCSSLIWDGKCHVVSDELCWALPSEQQGELPMVFSLARGCCE